MDMDYNFRDDTLFSSGNFEQFDLKKKVRLCKEHKSHLIRKIENDKFFIQKHKKDHLPFTHKDKWYKDKLMKFEMELENSKLELKRFIIEYAEYFI